MGKLTVLHILLLLSWLLATPYACCVGVYELDVKEVKIDGNVKFLFFMMMTFIFLP